MAARHGAIEPSTSLEKGSQRSGSIEGFPCIRFLIASFQIAIHTGHVFSHSQITICCLSVSRVPSNFVRTVYSVWFGDPHSNFYLRACSPTFSANTAPRVTDHTIRSDQDIAMHFLLYSFDLCEHRMNAGEVPKLVSAWELSALAFAPPGVALLRYCLLVPRPLG